MQIKWICERPDGSVYILGSAHVEQLIEEGHGATLSEIKAFVLSKLPEPAARVTEMPEGWEPPADRTFRNAWRGKGKAAEASALTPEIDVEMPHAREIHRDWLRRKRIPLMAELDVQYQKADERGASDAKVQIAREKQRLRDLPADPRIEAAKTAEELKAIGL